MKTIWPRDHELSEEFKDLFQEMYRASPDVRCSLKDIGNHEWMKGPVPEPKDIK